MTKAPRRTSAWIIVRQLSTGRRFPARLTEREHYQRDRDFQVLKGTYPTRAKARERL